MKSLPERASRGTRHDTLQGAAEKADMQFWNQDFFKEASDDNEFSDSHGSEPLSDSEDSDIDIPEDVDEQPIQSEKPEKKEKVKRTVYLDPAFKRKKQKKKFEVIKSEDGVVTESPIQPKPKPAAPPLELSLRASTKYKSIVSANQRQYEDEMDETSIRHRKKQPGRRLTQSQMLRSCSAVEVENTLSLHQILKEEEKKKIVTKKKIISGNRLCIYSSRKCPYYYLFSSPSCCPEWKQSIKPILSRCTFDDKKALYFDPSTKSPYCCMSCGKRLIHNKTEESLHVKLSLRGDKAFSSSKSTTVKSEISSQLSSTLMTTTNRVDSNNNTLSNMAVKPSLKMTVKTEEKLPTQSTCKEVPKPVQSAINHSMIITSTSTTGQTVQYQLDTLHVIYINSQAITVPVNQNQVYYLQTDLNGKKIVQPHLMSGTSRMKDGSIYYCMIPMLMIGNNPDSL